MDSVIFAGYLDSLNNANATEYNTPAIGCTWSTNVFNRSQVLASSGKIRNLYVELDAAAGTGADDTYTFTLMYDGAATSLTCAVVQGATTGNDTTHEIDVVAGKVISLRCVSSGTPSNTPNAQWSMMFSGTTANESLCAGITVCNAAAKAYAPISQGAAASTTTENNVRVICPTAGVIKNLYVILDNDPGTDPDAYCFTLRIANAANSYVLTDTALTCTIVANAVSGNDTTHSVTVAAGDWLTLSIDPKLTTPSVAPNAQYGFTFVATTDGESVLLGCSGRIGQVATRYLSLIPYIYSTVGSTTDGQFSQLAQVCTLKNLYVLLSVAPDTGAGTQSHTFTIRNNVGNSTAITTTISEAETTGNDTTNAATLAVGNNICLMVVHTNTPADSYASWGLVCYIAPVLFRSYYPHILAH